MSKQVDWSQAPEGATVLLKHVRDNSYAWAVSHADESDAWIVDGTCFGFRLMAYCWRVVSKRPSTPSWSGEGLPPVGVVCGKCYNSPSEYYNVKVLAHDDHYGEVVIYRWIEGPLEGELDQSTMHLNMASGSNAHWSFRPIRTPEQIAEDEREAAIKELKREMIPAYDAFAEPLLDVITRLGYRKP